MTATTNSKSHTSPIFPLTPQEVRFKEMYLHQDCKKLLSTPMQYTEYEQLIADHPDYVNLGGFYTHVTEHHLGNTIKDVSTISEGDTIALTRHERYAYPILHNHTFIEIAYVYSGSCTHYVEENSFEMVEGDFCVMAPHTTHVITALDDDTVILNLLLDKNFLDDSFFRLIREKQLVVNFFHDVLYGRHVSPYIIFPTGQDEDIHRTFYAMFRESEEKKYAYQEDLMLLARHILILVLRNYELLAKVSSPEEKRLNDRIVPILTYISQGYSYVTLASTAAFFGYNESYLSRLLKRYTGKNFVTIVTELQMTHARERIEESVAQGTDLSLTQIAQDVGCYDYSHFSRKFVKAYGMSPGAFRDSLEA